MVFSPCGRKQKNWRIFIIYYFLFFIYSTVRLAWAGIQAAQHIVRLGAQELITGHCGPKAFRVLSASGVKIYTTAASNAAEALGLLKSGKLDELGGADVEGHWV